MIGIIVISAWLHFSKIGSYTPEDRPFWFYVFEWKQLTVHSFHLFTRNIPSKKYWNSSNFFIFMQYLIFVDIFDRFSRLLTGAASLMNFQTVGRERSSTVLACHQRQPCWRPGCFIVCFVITFCKFAYIHSFIKNYQKINNI